MFEESLQKIGFNEIEARIYLELLKIGPQAVSVIAKRLNINRCTLYSILKSLEKKGVIASYNNNHMKFFASNDPNSLIGYLDRKCQTLDYYRAELLNTIPKFRSICGNYEFQKPIVSYFDGCEGVEHIIHKVLVGHGEFYSIMSPNKWQKSDFKNLLYDFKEYQIYNGNLPKKVIAPDIKEVKAYLKGYKTEILFVPADDKMFESEMNIFEDKVAIFHLGKNNEYGVVIESKEIAALLKGIFELAWKGYGK